MAGDDRIGRRASSDRVNLVVWRIARLPRKGAPVVGRRSVSGHAEIKAGRAPRSYLARTLS